MTQQNWNANDYAKHSSAQLKWAKELIDKIPFSGTESLLDIGCGDGKITAILAKKIKNGNVVGIDASESMISTAESNFSPNHYPNLCFKQMDASCLTFHEEFDVIFSNSTLHWIKDHGPVLKGISRALKSNGTCFLRFGGKGTLDSFQPMVNAMLCSDKWRDYFTSFKPRWWFYDAVTYTKWLKEHQLTPLCVSLITSDMIYKSRQGLEGWVRTTWHPYLNIVPDHLKNDFVTELVDRYLNCHPTNKLGHTCVKMIRLEVQAQKKKKFSYELSSNISRT